MVPSRQAKQKGQKLALREALAAKGRVKILGLTFDDGIKYFFGGNALTAIVVLCLIMIFLFKEGAEFFPDNRDSLQLYRRAGLEFADFADVKINDYTALGREWGAIRMELFERLTLREKKMPEEANKLLADFDRLGGAFSGAIAPTRALVGGWREEVVELKDAQVDNANMEMAVRVARESGDEAQAKEYEAMIVPLDFEAMQKKLRSPENLERYRALNREMEAYVTQLLAGRKLRPAGEISLESQEESPDAVVETQPIIDAPAEETPETMADSGESERAVETPQLKPVQGPFLIPGEGFEMRFQDFEEEVKAYFQGLPEAYGQMETWDPERPVSMMEALGSFFFGTRWLTNSFWQDFYGIIPLFVGSLLISVVALVIAVPFSLAAGIYINQLASKWEQNVVKPYIEFIGAIPSVVLGFFGIAVLGSVLREVSQWEWLAWIPGFPMSERLNILTAGVLLAFMAIPTIFTLVEDALNNVPRYFVEASYALGANKTQTIFRIMIPAALSGIIAAVLLGFGRVIGETMVVLLCAGNRIAIPDFAEGIGIFFQPTHTMTGIIAQEMGEVDQGSLHYRALFVVGMLLFLISLGLNYLAQRIVKKFRIGD